MSEALEALTTYSNEVTGESDTTLSEAVATLAEGYGGDDGISADDYALVNGITSFDISLSTGALRNYLFYGSTSLQNFSAPNYTGGISASALRSCTALTRVNAPKVTSLSANAFQGCTALTTLALPGITGMVGTDTIRGCTLLTAVDLGSPSQLGANFFNGNTRMNTLVLRKTSLVGLSNINAFTSTPFASGGSGGTIYIPKSLYDKLGTGTNDYKAAKNWSTLDGYGTVTWAAIEGSQYENYYADGTPISS